MKAPFSWDHFSDQPYQLKDRPFKKRMRRKEWRSFIATLFSTLLILPISLLLQHLIPKRMIDSQDFFGMSINLDKDPKLTKMLIDELSLTTLLIRFPLWEMERIEDYVAFIKTYKEKKIIINLMQDREHIDDEQQLRDDLLKVFTAFSPYIEGIQIGSTINRAKWGFFSVQEYLRFYQVAYKTKKQGFPELKLLGPSVIDFEYHFTIHALFNFFKIRYDALSALLYVDRRGAPENTQMGFDLTNKINLLDAITVLSPKSNRKIYITETNWPISNTAPYAPTSEYECVDEESYADFMVRYYLIAFASQKVDAVYWHQLIAPGYGLIDNREGIKKRTAFYAFKTMLEQLQGMQFHSYVVKDKLYTLTLSNNIQKTTVQWSLQPIMITCDTNVHYLDRDANVLQSEQLTLSGSPIYLIKKTTSHEC
jgi:hypothetical protein